MNQLNQHAYQIFAAGIAAVQPSELLQRHVTVNGSQLLIADREFDLDQLERLVIVGAGKASAAMARAVIDLLGDSVNRFKQITGWINVPEGVNVDIPGVTIHHARPANQNFPTPLCVAGTRQIIGLLETLTDRDLCLCMISGGGSALLCLPPDEISLVYKRQTTEFLSSQQASIQQINLVRQNLSQVKGGRLLNHVAGGQFVGFILSDVIGDPLELIASGPTIATQPQPQAAIKVLEQFDPTRQSVPASIWQHLERIPKEGNISPAIPRTVGESGPASKGSDPFWDSLDEPHIQPARVSNLLIGNLAMAVEGTVRCAEALGYQTTSTIQTDPLETVNESARSIVAQIRRFSSLQTPQAWIFGGEPVLRIEGPAGVGGRNLHLALTVIKLLLDENSEKPLRFFPFCFLSGGTDGEDGSAPTAGGWFDERLLAAIHDQSDELARYANAYDAFTFFRQHDATVDIAASSTNVGDLRVLLGGAAD